MLPLHVACDEMDASVETIKLLLSHSPEAASQCDEEDDLPLHLALYSGAPDDVIMVLLDCYPEGASARNAYRMLPLHVSYKRPEICYRLVKLYPEGLPGVEPDGDGNLPMHLVCMCPEADLKLVKLLFKQDPNALRHTRRDGRLPLHCVVLHNEWSSQKADIVQFLIDKYPLALQSADNNGKIPLHVACESQAPAHIIQLLLDGFKGRTSDKGGLRVVDSKGCIPLHYAVAGWFATDALQLLLNWDREGIYVKDNRGMLPLHVACAHRLGNNHGAILLLLDVDVFTILELLESRLSAVQLAFRARRWFRQPLENKRLLVSKQDEALQAKHQALEPNIEKHSLPDLVVAEIWGFALGILWRPSEEEYPRVQ